MPTSPSVGARRVATETVIATETYAITSSKAVFTVCALGGVAYGLTFLMLTDLLSR